jgi:hypothetical protein
MERLSARLAELAEFVGDEASAVLAGELAAQISRGELNLLIAGQFKRGKSTLVNALLGADVMPTGALPITGIAIAIRYAATPRAEVRLRRGEEAQPITVDQLALYASEKCNPGNALGVERIDVEWPSERIRGLAIFDTPGIGSTLEHNTQSARSALPRADAAVLVVGPDPPIGAQELHYAREVLVSSERLFVVLNKADIAGDALDELVEFTQKALSTITDGERIEVIPLSATRAREAQQRDAEDPHFEHFVRELQRFLREQGLQTRERSLRRRGAAIAARLQTLLSMWERALILPREERQRRRALVEKALQSVDDRLRALELTVDDDMAHLMLLIQGEIHRCHADEEVSELRVHAAELAKEPPRRRAALLEQLIAQKAEAWRHCAVEIADRELSAAAGKYARLLAELEVAALRAGCEALHVDAAVLEARDVTFSPAQLGPIASLVPTTGLELIVAFLADLLPHPVREIALRRKYEKMLSRELDALRGKLRYGITREIDPWRRSTKQTIRTSLEGTRQSVLRAFGELSSSFDDGYASDVERIKDLQSELAAIRRFLHADAQGAG